MSITSAIESEFSKLKAKLGNVESDIESAFESFLGKAKAAEADAQSKIDEEVQHLKGLGYTVTPPAETTDSATATDATSLPAQTTIDPNTGLPTA